ncbi:MAG: gamma-glutamylcyclotransferase [Rhodobacterales bacterium]|nr:gamma-glutamylcyclotransferase [Rhodobacterales bacterium]NCT12269.1 gamma-glutamylcyclotransferase [Rhodobacterales bacterium]
MQTSPIWVFGYGSLLWNPGFTPAEAVAAQLAGYQRCFCMLSIHHRGTEDDPGLVLALDPMAQSHCDGMALRVAQGETAGVLAMLRERELVSSAYVERWLPLRLADGREVTALAYVVDTAHRQYCRFDRETQARMIARARGGRGPNTEYLYNTAAHLRAMGIQDPEMAWIAARVRVLTGTAPE